MALPLPKLVSPQGLCQRPLPLKQTARANGEDNHRREGKNSVGQISRTFTRQTPFGTVRLFRACAGKFKASRRSSCYVIPI